MQFYYNNHKTQFDNKVIFLLCGSKTYLEQNSRKMKYFE